MLDVGNSYDSAGTSDRAKNAIVKYRAQEMPATADPTVICTPAQIIASVSPEIAARLGEVDEMFQVMYFHNGIQIEAFNKTMRERCRAAVLLMFAELWTMEGR